MKYGYFIFLFLLVCCKTAKKEQKMPLLECEVALAKDTVFKNSMNFTSQIYANSTLTLEPRINGYLAETYFKKGMPVTKGDLLFQIEPVQLNTDLTQAEANLAAAKAELTRTKNDYVRAVPLSKIKAISASSLDEYKSSYLSAESSVRAAEAKLKNARLNAGYTSVNAPVSGIIDDTGVSVGDWVGTGTNYTVLAYVYDVDSVSVKLAIAVNDYLGLKQRDSLLSPSYDNKKLVSDVVLTLSDGSVYPEKGVYDYTDSGIDNTTGTIILNVKFLNRGWSLKPNQFVDVTAKIGEEQTCVIIPQIAVSQTQGQNSVFVVTDENLVKYQTVELGQTLGDSWVIKKGLKKGDKVLTSGIQKVRSGQKIAIAEGKHSSK